jgi:rhodanese-related sulfurtransferase
MMARPELIDVEVAQEHHLEGRAEFVDARPPVQYRHSRERIPGAVHIDPGSGAEADDVLRTLRARS